MDMIGQNISQLQDIFKVIVSAIFPKAGIDLSSNLCKKQ
jgi:hypothetical protein